MLARILSCLALCLAVAAPLRADDFLSDLAGCAKTPLTAAKFATSDAKKAVVFLTNHGECVPMVVGGDPILYGTTASFIGLQSNGTLPSGYGACVDATLGQSSKVVANILKDFVSTPPLASVMPAAGKAKLVQIAQGEIEEGLYSVPGIAVVAERLDCACAVTGAGLNIEQLKERIKEVVDGAGDCKQVLGKLLGGAYKAGEAAYEAGKDFVNSVGCELGLGGCSDGPPLFCTGYVAFRDKGVSYEQLQKMLGALFPDQVQKCEQDYAKLLVARQEKALADAEKKLFDQEMAKAEQTGAAHAFGFALRWGKKCLDQPCKASIAKIADSYTTDILDPETISYYKFFNTAVAAMEKKYGAQATIAIILSKKRVRKDASAPVELRLQAYDCAPFLGRPRQSLCPTGEAFAVCRTYVQRNAWDACAVAGKPGLFSAGEALDRLVRRGGCIPDQQRGIAIPRGIVRPVMTAQCLAARARSACEVLRKGGSALLCQGPVEIARFDPNRYRARARPPLVLPGVRPIPTERAPEPSQPPAIRIAPGLRPLPAQRSTLCLFDAGPRAGERQDYAPMDPLPVGTPCRDGRGSTGRVVAP